MARYPIDGHFPKNPRDLYLIFKMGIKRYIELIKYILFVFSFLSYQKNDIKIPKMYDQVN